MSFALSVRLCLARIGQLADGAGWPLNMSSGLYSQALQQHEHVTSRRH